jgi:intracellular multiplication protein IcmO
MKDEMLLIVSVPQYYGREDDVRHMNFINGSRSRAQELLDDDKSRPETNTRP